MPLGDVAADALVTAATAKTHVNRATAKASARDRARLVVFAHRGGLL